MTIDETNILRSAGAIALATAELARMIAASEGGRETLHSAIGFASYLIASELDRAGLVPSGEAPAAIMNGPLAVGIERLGREVWLEILNATAEGIAEAIEAEKREGKPSSPKPH